MIICAATAAPVTVTIVRDMVPTVTIATTTTTVVVVIVTPVVPVTVPAPATGIGRRRRRGVLRIDHVLGLGLFLSGEVQRVCCVLHPLRAAAIPCVL